MRDRCACSTIRTSSDYLVSQSHSFTQGAYIMDAIVTATVRKNEETIVRKVITMSSDLPAQNLGELVAEVLADSYEKGNDPVDIHIVLHFS